MHVLDTHEAAALANEHDTPHVPQFDTLVVVSVSQPFAAMPSQSPRPAAQLVTMHIPPEQPGVPPAVMHTFPHEAQLLTLVFRLVSQPSAVTMLQLPNPALHAEITHVPAEQPGVAFANEQLVLQFPQRVESVLRFVSQPSAESPLQFPYPATHAKLHAVPSHVDVALAGTVQGVHDAPQLLTLELLAHAPPQLW